MTASNTYAQTLMSCRATENKPGEIAVKTAVVWTMISFSTQTWLADHNCQQNQMIDWSSVTSVCCAFFVHFVRSTGRENPPDFTSSAELLSVSTSLVKYQGFHRWKSSIYGYFIFSLDWRLRIQSVCIVVDDRDSFLKRDVVHYKSRIFSVSLTHLFGPQMRIRVEGATE